jgi:hypothetical protein
VIQVRAPDWLFWAKRVIPTEAYGFGKHQMPIQKFVLEQNLRKGGALRPVGSFKAFFAAFL